MGQKHNANFTPEVDTAIYHVALCPEDRLDFFTKVNSLSGYGIQELKPLVSQWVCF